MGIDELRDRYDELDGIISNVEDAIKKCDYYKDLKEELEYIKFEAQKEQEEIEPQLRKAEDEEQKAQEREYWASQF